jgi:hypothetical protein
VIPRRYLSGDLAVAGLKTRAAASGQRRQDLVSSASISFVLTESLQWLISVRHFAAGEIRMPRIAENFFKAAVTFFVIGILMGLQMSISGEHNVIGAHAHTNLLGWVTMATFGGYYALNPGKAETRLAAIHFWSYLAAVCVMVPSLYLLYLGYAAFEPPLAAASIVALLSVFAFALIVFSRPEAESQRSAPAAPAE